MSFAIGDPNQPFPQTSVFSTLLEARGKKTVVELHTLD